MKFQTKLEVSHQIQAITWAHPTPYLTDTGDKTDGTTTTTNLQLVSQLIICEAIPALLS